MEQTHSSKYLHSNEINTKGSPTSGGDVPRYSRFDRRHDTAMRRSKMQNTSNKRVENSSSSFYGMNDVTWRRPPSFHLSRTSRSSVWEEASSIRSIFKPLVVSKITQTSFLHHLTSLETSNYGIC